MQENLIKEGLINDYNDVKRFLNWDLSNHDIYLKSEKIIKEEIKNCRDQELMLQHYYYMLFLELKRKVFVTGKTNQLHKKVIDQIFLLRNNLANKFDWKDKKFIKTHQFELLSFEKICNNYLRSIEQIYRSKGSEDIWLEMMITRYRVERTVFRILKKIDVNYLGRFIWISILKYSSNYWTSFKRIAWVTFWSISGFASLFWIVDHLFLTPDKFIVTEDRVTSYLLYSMWVFSNLGTMSTPAYAGHEVLVLVEWMYGLMILWLLLNLLYQKMK